VWHSLSVTYNGIHTDENLPLKLQRHRME